jgi:signal transduction histidine kinase
LHNLKLKPRAVFNALENFIAAEQQLRRQRAARQRSAYYVVFVLVPVLTALVIAILSYWGWRQIESAAEQFRETLNSAERARDAAERASATADKANRAKDNFVGMVSHELRTALNSIMLWSAALLRNPALREDARRGIQPSNGRSELKRN